MELKIVKPEPGREFERGEVWRTPKGGVLLRLGVVAPERPWVVLISGGHVWRSGTTLNDRADSDAVEFLGYIDG